MIETCECKAQMKPRWSRDSGPKVFMRTRCGKSVPGYERLVLMRAKQLKEKDDSR